MKKSYQLLALILSAGTIFAFYTVVIDFMRFWGFEGTIFRLTDCVVPNPVTTPCFWGAWAFLIALIWSIKIIRMNSEKQTRQSKFLAWFLVAGNLFAWTNFTLILVKFLKNHGQPTVGCSGVVTTNPMATPCFIGSCLFLLALLTILIINFKNHPKNRLQISKNLN